jgi:histidinol-phosphate aminotransferase
MKYPLLYQPGRKEGYINLADNENPYDIPINLKYKLQEALLSLPLSQYPDPYADNLRERLTEYLKVEKEKIFIGNGSDELIFLLTLAAEVKSVVFLSPTFPIYELAAKILKLTTYKIPLQEDSWELSFNDYKKYLSNIPKLDSFLTFISYPNSPTGNCLKAEVIHKIIKHNYPNWVVIDEAYFEFSGYSFIKHLANYSNLIILRSFSKGFSLAGLRIGYVIAAPSIVAKLFSLKLPYNVNSFSLLAAQIILDNRNLLKPYLNTIKRERNFIYKFLSSQNFLKPYPSLANFILFYSPYAVEIYECLLKSKITVRKFDKIPLKDRYLRVTIGKPEDNATFCTALLNFKENYKQKVTKSKKCKK